MAIHIDIYAHLVKSKMVKEGDELRRYVERLEKDLNKRWADGAVGRSDKIIKAQDGVTRSTNKMILRQEALRKEIFRSRAEGESQGKYNKRRMKALSELTVLVQDLTVAEKQLGDAEKEHTDRLRNVNSLVGKNKKAFADLTRVTNKQRRELESLRDANGDLVKGNKAVTTQMDAVTRATKRTTKERKKYNKMVKDGTATYDQYLAQSERVREAHENERDVVERARASIAGLAHERGKHDVVVKANARSLRTHSRMALLAKREMDTLRHAQHDTIKSSAALTRSFDGVALATEKAYREHQEYNRMARDGSVTQDKLRSQLERTNNAYRDQATAISNASSALTRHQEQASESTRKRIERERREAANRATTGNKNMDFNPGRWAARNLGALTPLGVVTPTLVIPLGLAFTQVANAAVAASQGIALLPASLAAAGAGFATIKMATAGFGDTIGAMMDGDLEKFAEEIQKLSPAAQQAALTIQHLAPKLREMQQAAQEAFFTGMPQMIYDMSHSLGPMVQEMTTGVATALSESMRGVGDMLMSPEGLQDIETITTRIVELFQQMRPAIVSFSQAFLTLSRVGADFLPIMADDIAEVAERFSGFLDEARNSGALREFMYDGWEAIKAVGGAIKDIGGMLYRVFGLEGKDDVDAFRETMRELTDLMEVVLGTLKKFFEGIAVIFKEASDFAGLFGVDLGDISSTLATVAGAWLFVHGIKFFNDLRKSILAVNTALTGTAAASGVAGAASAGGAVGALGKFASAAAGLAGPLMGAAAAIGSVAAISLWYFNLSKHWGEDLPETLPNMPTNLDGTPKPGGRPGTGGIPFPELSTSDQARLDYLGLNPRTMPIEELYRVLGRPVPPPGGGGPGAGGTLEDGLLPQPKPMLWGEVSEWAVPDAPYGSTRPDGSVVEIPSNLYSMDGIGIGQMPGAEWEVPAGIMDLPDPRGTGPAGPGHGGRKPGYFEVDPWDVTQAQWAADDARQRLEERRMKLLEIQQKANHTQAELNDAAHGVIEAERGWLEQMRNLKEAERGEFKELEGDFKGFASGLKESLGDLGMALDSDFGVSEGLAGIAENLVKFFATLGAAPLLGLMKGHQAALGFPGAEGSGSGLAGILGSLSGRFSPYSSGSSDPRYQQLGPMMPGMTVPGVYGQRPGPYQQQPFLGARQGNGTWDESILDMVPSGEYVLGGADLLTGLADCTSSIEDLVNIVDGRPTEGRSMATGNAASWLRERGFLPNPTGADIPGAFNVGFWDAAGNGGHMQATTPDGTFFNWGDDTSAGRRGRSGGGAHAPSMTSMAGFQGWYRPMAQRQTVPIRMPQVQGRARGGSIAASDTVPAMLTPGEHVLTVDDVKALGGQSGVYALRSRLQGFAGGGPVDSGHNGFWGEYGRKQGLSSKAFDPITWASQVPHDAHSDAEIATRTGRLHPDYGLTSERGNFNPAIQIDTSTTRMGSPSAWERARREFSLIYNKVFPMQFETGFRDVNNPLAPPEASLVGFSAGGGVPPPQTPPPTPPAPTPPGPLSGSEVANPGLTTPEQAGRAGAQLPAVSRPENIPGAPLPGAPLPPALDVPGAAPIAGQLPGGIRSEGTTIGGEVGPYEGYGSLSIGGGLVGALGGAASSAAGMAASGAAMGMDGGMGGAAASAAIQIGIEEISRAIEFGAQAAGIGVQGLIDTALPAGGSALAQENWLTRIAGGFMGAVPNLANMAGGVAQDQLGQGADLAGVGGGGQPGALDALGAQPSRTQHFGGGNQPGVVGPGPEAIAARGFARGGAVPAASGSVPAGGKVQNGVFIQNYEVKSSEDRAGQDLFNRYYAGPGRR